MKLEMAEHFHGRRGLEWKLICESGINLTCLEAREVTCHSSIEAR